MEWVTAALAGMTAKRGLSTFPWNAVHHQHGLLSTLLGIHTCADIEDPNPEQEQILAVFGYKIEDGVSQRLKA